MYYTDALLPPRKREIKINKQNKTPTLIVQTGDDVGLIIQNSINFIRNRNGTDVQLVSPVRRCVWKLGAALLLNVLSTHFFYIFRKQKYQDITKIERAA